MEIKLLDDGLLIIPETDFEKEYIEKYFNKDLSSFIKYNGDLSDIIGIKITNNEKEYNIGEVINKFNNTFCYLNESEYKIKCSDEFKDIIIKFKNILPYIGDLINKCMTIKGLEKELGEISKRL